jgi:hypothetical protein
MIAYHAETSMVNMIRPQIAHPDEARTLLQQIYKTDANIYPDHKDKKLIAEIHSLNYHKDDKFLLQLCQQRNRNQIPRHQPDLNLQNGILLNSAEISCSEVFSLKWIILTFLFDVFGSHAKR